jgi:TetR/AcrR family transcriptional regulator, repressor for uid operon
MCLDIIHAHVKMRVNVHLHIWVTMSRIGDQRRSQILTAAEKLFARKGFHQTSIDDVCRATKLSPGSLYRYFKNKTAIIEAWVEAELQATLALFQELDQQQDFFAGLESVLNQALMSLHERKTFALEAEITAEAFRNKAIAALLTEAYEATFSALSASIKMAQQRKQLDPEINPRHAADFIVALFDGLWWRFAIQPELQTRHLAAELLVMLQRYLKPRRN